MTKPDPTNKPEPTPVESGENLLAAEIDVRQKPPMPFADIKNDYVFRRIFAMRPDLVVGLLNDLLERKDEETIDTIEYLPSEQLPQAEGLKLSILDVRCKERSGTTFIVEMQLLHHPGFMNRVVYNACKAYVAQLKAGQRYKSLADVVAISICDFELWPDSQQAKENLPLVPMLSRWNIAEKKTGNHGLLQVQYVFLELPKAPKERPTARGPELWAWLFAHAPELTEIPEDLPPSPQRDALALANEATFSPGERDVYERVQDEIWVVHVIAEDRLAKGKAEGKAGAVLSVLAARGLPISEEMRARVEGCRDLPTLDAWLVRAATATSPDEVVTP